MPANRPPALGASVPPTPTMGRVPVGRGGPGRSWGGGRPATLPMCDPVMCALVCYGIRRKTGGGPLCITIAWQTDVLPANVDPASRVRGARPGRIRRIGQVLRRPRHAPDSITGTGVGPGRQHRPGPMAGFPIMSRTQQLARVLVGIRMSGKPSAHQSQAIGITASLRARGRSSVSAISFLDLSDTQVSRRGRAD